MERIIYKTPAELDFYNLNYSSSLAGDIITGSTWLATDTAMTVNNPEPTVSGLITQVWIAGGTINVPGAPADVTNSVTTEGGRDLLNAIKVVVQQYNLMPNVVVKKMVAQLADYTLDWTDRLLNGLDTIVTSSWASSDPGLNVAGYPSQIGVPPITTTVWLAGGGIGKSYIVTNTVTTALGRVMEQSLIVIVQKFVVGS